MCGLEGCETLCPRGQSSLSKLPLWLAGERHLSTIVLWDEDRISVPPCRGVCLCWQQDKAWMLCCEINPAQTFPGVCQGTWDLCRDCEIRLLLPTWGEMAAEQPMLGTLWVNFCPPLVFPNRTRWIPFNIFISLSFLTGKWDVYVLVLASYGAVG